MTAPTAEAVVDVGAMIVSTPGTVGGRPRIAGTRMPVHALAHYHVGEGMTAEQIHDEVYTHLELVQIYAGLAYFHANREQIEEIWAEDEWFFDQVTKAYPKQSIGPGDDLRPLNAILEASQHRPWRTGVAHSPDLSEKSPTNATPGH